MGRIQNNYFDFVEYALRRGQDKEVIISEPVGWQDDQKEIVRDLKSHGKKVKFNSNLEFYDVEVEGKENSFKFLKSVYEIYGINAVVTLEKRILDPDDFSGNRKVTEYIMTLDYSTMEIIEDEKGRRIKIKSNDEGIGQILIARLSEQVEIERIDTIDGKSLPELNFQKVELDGKKIFFDTLLENNSVTFADFDMFSLNPETQFGLSALPLETIYKSDPDIKEASTGTFVYTPSDYAGAGFVFGKEQQLFFLNSQNNSRTLNLDINIEFDLNVLSYLSLSFGKISLIRYQDVYNTVEEVQRIDLLSLDPLNLNNGKKFTYSNNFDININQNDGLGIFIIGTKNFTQGSLTFVFENLKSSLQIQEENFQEKSNANLLLPFELFTRLIKIKTNQTDTVLKSNFLGRTDIGYSEDGIGSLTGVTTGTLLRGFEDTDFQTKNDQNRMLNEGFFVRTSLQEIVVADMLTRDLR